MNYLKENSIKAVWFDAFWTLIEGKNNSSKVFYKIIKKYWWDVSKINLLTTNYSSNPETFFKETIIKSWINYNKIPQVEILNLLKTFNNDFENYKLIENTEKLIRKVKENVDYIFLISNLSSLYIPVIRKLGLENYFNFVFYSCEMWEKKTTNNPKIFNTANIYLNTLPDTKIIIPKKETLFVWDNYQADIIAPKNAWFETMDINKFRKKILN
jgi:FMN phosphatase YigB (HAD superfamily)